MKGFATRAMCSAFSLWLVFAAVPGIGIAGGDDWPVCALAVGLSSGLTRTVIVFYVLPLRLGTVAGLSLALNAVVMGLLAALVDGFAVEGAVAAVIGWLALAGLVSLVTLYIGPNGTLYSLIPASRRRAAR